MITPLNNACVRLTATDDSILILNLSKYQWVREWKPASPGEPSRTIVCLDGNGTITIKETPEEFYKLVQAATCFVLEQTAPDVTQLDQLCADQIRSLPIGYGGSGGPNCGR